MSIVAPPFNAGNPGGCVDNTGAAVIADQCDGARLTRCDMGAFEFAACLLIGDVDDDGDADVTDITKSRCPGSTRPSHRHWI